MNIQTEWVNLNVSDGTKMRSYVATPATPPRAALLVFPEIFGINSHIRDITERFARQGYLAVAPELFHRSGPGFECGYSEAEIGQGIGLSGKFLDAIFAEETEARAVGFADAVRGMRLCDRH